MFATKEEIVDDYINTLREDIDGEEEIQTLYNYKEENLIRLHHNFGRYIRNRYALWATDNPLTVSWFEAQKAGDCTYVLTSTHRELTVIDAQGTGCHPNHPDAVSMDIIRMIWAKLHSPKRDLVSLIDLDPGIEK